MVAPQASSELGGADNTAVVGVGHNALLEDSGVSEFTLGAITSGVGIRRVDFTR